MTGTKLRGLTMHQPKKNAAVSPPAPDDELGTLLDGAFAAQWPPEAQQGDASALRQRILSRVDRCVQASQMLTTVRGQAGWQSAPGLRWRTLYQAASSRAPAVCITATTATALRPGEPQRVRLLELNAGASCRVELVPGAMRSEWLVVAGQAEVGGVRLSALDYHVRPAVGALEVRATEGATLYLREAPEPGVTASDTLTVRDAETGWSDFAPGIKRRVLWQRGAEAAMLYQTLPGAAVSAHGHGHDEECLMLDGEIFLDDVLLRPGEYQLAPAGTGHEGVSTDTGGMLFAHGDIDLALRPQKGMSLHHFP